jgi:dihydroorotate dehydrogenase
MLSNMLNKKHRGYKGTCVTPHALKTIKKLRKEMISIFSL